MTGAKPLLAGADATISKRDLLKAGGALTLAMLTGTARRAFAPFTTFPIRRSNFTMSARPCGKARIALWPRQRITLRAK